MASLVVWIACFPLALLNILALWLSGRKTAKPLAIFFSLIWLLLAVVPMVDYNPRHAEFSIMTIVCSILFLAPNFEEYRRKNLG